MIFKPVLIEKILAGRKTMTRRPLKPYAPPASPWIITKGGQRRRRPLPRTVDHAGHSYLAPYCVGKAVPIQKGRGKHAVTHVEITSLRHEPVGAISYADARAEGFHTTNAFKAYWTRLYDQAWIDRELLDRIAVYDDQESIVDDILIRRFEQEHADTLVWVIEFQPCDPPARYLKPAAGYTHIRSQSITRDDDVDGADLEPDDRPTGDDAYLAGPRPPVPLHHPARREASEAERAALRSRLRGAYLGWEPEDVVADDPRYGTPGDVRAMRRAMGLRGTDGLDPIPPDELERVLAFMLYRGASVREIMLAMDWSLGKTQRELAARGRAEPLPGWLQANPDSEAA